MKINTNSWHYLVIKHICSPSKMPTSLCPYIQALILRLGISAFAVILIVVLMGLVGIGFFSTLAEYYNLVFDFVNTKDPFANHWYIWPALILVGIVVATGVIGIAAAAVGLIVLIVGLCNHGTKILEKSDNVLIKYAIAKHNKICPKIEYKD